MCFSVNIQEENLIFVVACGSFFFVFNTSE